jgi:hypothetical protein
MQCGVMKPVLQRNTTPQSQAGTEFLHNTGTHVPDCIIFAAVKTSDLKYIYSTLLSLIRGPQHLLIAGSAHTPVAQSTPQSAV